MVRRWASCLSNVSRYRRLALRAYRLTGGLLALLFGIARAQAQAPAPAADGDQAAVSAGEADVQPQSSDQQPHPSKKWEFSTIGYVWFAGAWGKTDVIGPVPPVDLDLPFGKVLKAFKFAFMGAAEAKHDRIVILGDLTYIHLGTHEGIGIRDPDFLEGKVDSKTSEVTLLAGYRVVDDKKVTLDLLAGGRLNFFKVSIKLEGPNREADGSTKQTWLDPLIGARVAAPLGGKWSLALYGDVGGIIAGSDVTWQAVPSINYQLNPKMSIGGGWRYFKVNFRNGDFLYDVHQSGPLITFRSLL